MPRNGIKKQFWLSEKHVKKLAALSKKTGHSETTIIRFLLDGYHPKEAPGEDLIYAIYGLIDSVNKMESIAKTCSDTELQKKLLSEADALEELRWNLMEKYLDPEKVEKHEMVKNGRIK